jgi:hypothetical protein
MHLINCFYGIKYKKWERARDFIWCCEKRRIPFLFLDCLLSAVKGIQYRMTHALVYSPPYKTNHSPLYTHH